jgi:hypothetical protein
VQLILDTFRVTKRFLQHLNITQHVFFTTRPLARCWKPVQLSLACAINIGHISSYKMISVALEHYTACILYN